MFHRMFGQHPWSVALAFALLLPLALLNLSVMAAGGDLVQTYSGYWPFARSGFDPVLMGRVLIGVGVIGLLLQLWLMNTARRDAYEGGSGFLGIDVVLFILLLASIVTTDLDWRRLDSDTLALLAIVFLAPLPGGAVLLVIGWIERHTAPVPRPAPPAMTPPAEFQASAKLSVSHFRDDVSLRVDGDRVDIIGRRMTAWQASAIQLGQILVIVGVLWVPIALATIVALPFEFTNQATRIAAYSILLAVGIVPLLIGLPLWLGIRAATRRSVPQAITYARWDLRPHHAVLGGTQVTVWEGKSWHPRWLVLKWHQPGDEERFKLALGV